MVTDNPTRCACGAALYTGTIFCSRRCSNISRAVPLHELPLCVQCGVRRVRRRSQWLCSRTCANGYRWRSVEERFLDYCRPGKPDECWLFTGTIQHRRYGVLTGKNNKQFFAHRVAYERANGPIPSGLYVCHTCDNPPCCNPAHLFLGTDAENQADKARKGRAPRGERNHNAKLSEADVIAIRNLSPQVSQTELAKRFGIHQTLISKIVRRTAWKHVA